MSNPSLLCVPYRFKTSTLYSQIPDSGLGDFTVTRSASNVATRVNASGFIETVADNVPRLDYPLGGIANGCPALLVEPSAQNLCFQSEALNTSPWGTSNATVTANAISSPDNNLTADQINYTANVASRVFQTIASSNSTTYTYSVFIKNNTFLTGELALLRFENNLAAPNNFEIRASIDPTNIGAAIFSLIGTAGTGTSGTVSGSVQDYGNGWWRVRVTGTSGTAAASATASIRIQQSSSVIARSLYAWGAQLEVGSIATSYIPTTTAAITRGAETISKTGVSSLIGQTEGTIYWEGSFGNAQSALAQDGFQIGINANNYIYFGVNSGRPYFRLRANAINAVTISPIGNVIQNNQKTKIAIAYKSGDSALFVNGTQIGSTNTTAFTFASSLSVVEIGSSLSSSGSEGFSNSPKKPEAIGLFPTRLTNAQLQSLTQ